MLLAGPGEFAKLDDPYATVAKIFLFTASVAAVVALGAAIWAGSATTRKMFLLSGPALRRASREATRTAVCQIAISRCATAVALALLIASAGFLFFAPVADPSC